MNHWRAGAGVVVLLLVAAPALRAAEPSWRVERPRADIVVPLKPGGAFTATNPNLSGGFSLVPGKPARLTGEIVMDLQTIDTGISLRNQHLREKYLEVAKGAGYDKAVLSDVVLKDAGDGSFVGRTAFEGTLLLHAVKKPIQGTADIKAEGAGRRIQAEFRLVMPDFDITPPEYLGVGVGSTLLVKVQLSAVPAAK